MRFRREKGLTGETEAERGKREDKESLETSSSVAESASRSSCAVRSPVVSAIVAASAMMTDSVEDKEDSELASRTNGSLFLPFPLPLLLALLAVSPSAIVSDVGRMSFFRTLSSATGTAGAVNLAVSVVVSGGLKVALERCNTSYTALSWSISVSRLRETLKPYRLTSAWSAGVVHSSKYGMLSFETSRAGIEEGPAAAFVLYEGEDGAMSWPLSLVDRRDIMSVVLNSGRRPKGSVKPGGCWQNARLERTRKAVVRFMQVSLSCSAEKSSLYATMIPFCEL